MKSVAAIARRRALAGHHAIYPGRILFVVVLGGRPSGQHDVNQSRWFALGFRSRRLFSVWFF